MVGLRERQKEERRRQILVSAEALFRDQGYEDTTIAQIADMTGISHATVINYFGSKGELLLMLVAEENSHLVDLLKNTIARKEGDALVRITAFLTTIADVSFSRLDRRSWRHVLASAVTSVDSEFGQVYADLRSDLVGLFVSLLETLRREGELPASCNPDILGRVIYHYHYGLFERLVADEAFTLLSYKRRLKADIGHVLGHLADGTVEQ